MEEPGRTVLGRDSELARIDDWLTTVPTGEAGLLVIAGEPGIGKTTLWAQASRRAGALGYLVLSSRPVPSDAGLPHVVLADLLRPVADDAFSPLPVPQRRALEVALLRAEPEEAGLDPRAVGTGLTALLDGLAADRPLLLAVDDAQWLDPASARVVAFALRRLAQRQVALVAAVRLTDPADPGGRGEFAAVESSLSGTRLVLGPLSVAAMHQMYTRGSPLVPTTPTSGSGTGRRRWLCLMKRKTRSCTPIPCTPSPCSSCTPDSAPTTRRSNTA